MISKKVIAYVELCEFYDDGTYMRSNGNVSWWKRCDKGVSVKHFEFGDWLPLYDGGRIDRHNNKQLCEAIDRYIEEQIFEDK